MTLSSFAPVYCGRSDGETELRSKKYGRESNGPSSDQLDRVSNPDDFYEALDHDHSITIEWKRQLGVMLQREINVKSDNPWFLMFFPENYRLFKHNKGSKDNAGRSVQLTYQMSDIDRCKDTFLYGYPQGRKKRFKSAQEFFPHLLWLMEGKSEDYGDCACKNCAGEWVHKIEPLPGRGAFVPVGKETPQPKKEAIPRKDSLQTKEPISAGPRVVVPQKPLPQPSNLARPPTKAPTPTSATSGPPRPVVQLPVPSPLPPLRSREQELDWQYRKYIYRVGELVWFNRGTAWGLSLVIRRDTVKDPQIQNGRARYLVQPLSHPLKHPEQKLMTSDDTLRPWLAWSAPGPTHRALMGKPYSTIDWKGVVAGLYGQGDAEVDGSILAAKQIDDGFALLSQLANNTLTTGERTYLSLFLGGEKIYVGEPVRLRIHQGQDIMVVHEIIEKLKPNSTNVNLASVYVVGDIYRLFTVPFDPSNIKFMSNPHLPARMKADLDFRNNVTLPTKKVHSYWKLMQPSYRLTIADIKGRWYESSILLPILRTNAMFAADIKRGEITDVGDWINGRGDANAAAGKMGMRYRDRIEAVGRAVPSGLVLGGPEGKGEGGIEPALTQPPAALTPRPMSGSSTPRTAPSNQINHGIGSGVSDLSQYVDVDKMEE